MLRKIFLGRLPRYFAFVFLKHLAMILLIFGALIYLITFVEILRKTAGDDFTLLVKIIMTGKQIPYILEQVLPLLMLIAAIWAVVSLSVKSELVVAKAAGVSQWRLMTNFSCLSLIIGTVIIFAINPLSTKWIKEYYQWNATRRLKVIHGFSEKIVHNHKDVIITAKTFAPKDHRLENVEFFYLDDNKILETFIHADTAQYDFKKRIMQLKNIRIIEGKDIQIHKQEDKTIILPEIEPFLTVQTKVNNLYNFYEYPDVIKRAEKNETNDVLLKSQYYALISFPFLCAVMTMVATLTAPRSVRKGGLFKTVALGLFLGFGIYVFDIILLSLGRSEILPLLVSVGFVKVFSIIALLWFILWREYGYAE